MLIIVSSVKLHISVCVPLTFYHLRVCFFLYFWFAALGCFLTLFLHKVISQLKSAINCFSEDILIRKRDFFSFVCIVQASEHVFRTPWYSKTSQLANIVTFTEMLLLIPTDLCLEWSSLVLNWSLEIGLEGWLDLKRSICRSQRSTGRWLAKTVHTTSAHWSSHRSRI